MFGDKYATLVDLKKLLLPDDQQGDTTNDARYSSALDAASRGIEQITGRQFNNSGSLTTRKYNPDAPYLCELDDIVDNTGMIVEVNTAVWTEDLHYQCEPLNGVKNQIPGWPIERIVALQMGTFLPVWPRRASVVVTANFGWPIVPTPIYEACLIGAEELALLKDAPFGVGGYGEFGIVKAKNNPFVQRLCEQYVLEKIMWR